MVDVTHFRGFRGETASRSSRAGRRAARNPRRRTPVDRARRAFQQRSDRRVVRGAGRHRIDSSSALSVAAAGRLHQSPLAHARHRHRPQRSGSGAFLSGRVAGHSEPDDGFDRPGPAAGDERLSRGPDLHHHVLRGDPFGHHGAQPPALWPVVGIAADRFSAALQFGLSRRHDELSVRHRPFAVGARSVGGVARARNGAASRGIDAVRAGAVFLSFVLGRGLRARPVRVRAAATADIARTPAAVVSVRNVGRTDGRRRCSISSHAGCRSCR